MTTSKTKKSPAKIAKKLEIVTPTKNDMSIEGLVVAFNDQTLKVICALASSVLYQAPQFTNQTNPENIIGLADLMYRYSIGEVKVTPTEKASTELPKS